MDLLSQYKQEHPEAFREQRQSPVADEYGRAYTGMTAWVIRISGGRIRDARQATTVLLIVTVVIAAVAAYIFISAIGGGANAPLPYEQTYKPLR